RGDAEPVLPAAREVEGARHFAALSPGGGVVSGARAWLVAASVAAGLAGGCSDGVSSPSGMGVPLGQEFTLAVGQVASVEGASLRLALRAVRNDSRCPVDVQCVWEGDATVFLDVAGSSATAAYELHTSGRFP